MKKRWSAAWSPAALSVLCGEARGGSKGQRYDFVFVDQIGFEKHAPKAFAALAASFKEFKD